MLDFWRIKPLSASYYRPELVYNMENNYDYNEDCDDVFEE